MKRGYYDIAELLIERGANTAITGSNNKTALDAILQNKVFMSKVLLKHDLLNIEDESGFTLLMKACQNKSEEDILFLQGKGSDFFFENSNGESAYKILKRKLELPHILQSLKESLVLSQMVDLTKTIEAPGL